jgi:phosphoglucosamine mutase
MSRTLFGTDGIRGVAGERPLDEATVSAFGCALGKDIREHGGKTVLIGMDTRESGQWIAESIAGGLREQGVTSAFAGVITTPGVAYLTRSEHFDAGVMVSASHNPYQDNGIKVFASTGYKLPDEEELEVEREIFRVLPQQTVPAEPLEPDVLLAPRYADYLLSTLPARLAGMHVAIDCGNGAASRLAPELFRRAGARVTSINDKPNGRNINLKSGALYPERLAEIVVAEKAAAGVAFDGDADRAIFVSSGGSIVNGDAVMLILARSLKQQAKLAGDTLVSTVMSNLGLEVALTKDGMRMVRTPVGDKYVLEEMRRLGASLGGEQSGHVIFHEFATTGDGMLTALHLFSISRTTGKTLQELSGDMEVFPQKLVNIRVKERRNLEGMAGVQDEILLAEKTLDGAGRVLVRFSGTEPLARVMVEGRDPELVERFSQSIAKAIEQELA